MRAAEARSGEVVLLATRALDALEAAARSDKENLMPLLVECCHAYATVGEMVESVGAGGRTVRVDAVEEACAFESYTTTDFVPARIVAMPTELSNLTLPTARRAVPAVGTAVLK